MDCGGKAQPRHRFRAREGHVLHLIPQSFHRVEFRAIRGQGQQMNPGRQVRIAGAGMKTGLIINDHMFGLRITVGQLL